MINAEEVIPLRDHRWQRRTSCTPTHFEVLFSQTLAYDAPLFCLTATKMMLLLVDDWRAYYEYMLRYLPEGASEDKENEPPTLNENRAVVYHRNRTYARRHPELHRGILRPSISGDNFHPLPQSRNEVTPSTSDDESLPELIGRHQINSSSSEESTTDPENEAMLEIDVRGPARSYSWDEPAHIYAVTYTTWDDYIRNLRQRIADQHVHALTWEHVEETD